MPAVDLVINFRKKDHALSLCSFICPFPVLSFGGVSLVYHLLNCLHAGMWLWARGRLRLGPSQTPITSL
jgi:hypothetical protein